MSVHLSGICRRRHPHHSGSGKFTPEQRAVYQLVRDAQAAAEKVAKPGASSKAWSDTARAVEARG